MAFDCFGRAAVFLGAIETSILNKIEATNKIEAAKYPKNDKASATSDVVLPTPETLAAVTWECRWPEMAVEGEPAAHSLWSTTHSLWSTTHVMCVKVRAPQHTPSG